MIYAGIGAWRRRRTCRRTLTVIAGWLAPTCRHLSGGGTDGADTAFAGRRAVAGLAGA